MVAFATLLLGLVFGPLDVELVVAEQVASVDLLLDGEVVATLAEPPWAARVDLGAEPAPRLLEAVAYDGLAGEIGRASQWINLPRDAADLELTLERDPEGSVAAARLTWESVSGEAPSRVSLTFDGAPVAVDDASSIPLPAHDPELLHFLRAEVEFTGGLTAGTEAVFGGSFTAAATTTLTAVVIELDRRRGIDRDDLEGAFRVGETRPRVVAVEKEPADVVIVRSPAASEWAVSQGPARRVRVPVRPDVSARAPRLEVRREWRAQLLWPVTRRSRGATRSYDLFPHSQHLRPDDGDLAALVRLVEAPAVDGPLRIADAVAVAGMTAAAADHRRAVVLVVGDDAARDESDLAPAAAARFLARLRVPLEVWTVAEDPAVTEAWRPAAELRSARDLENAVRDLLARLDRQRVVWLESDQPAVRIEVDADAEGLRLAGGPRP